MPHLVSGMKFPKTFTNLLMMSPCYCHLIFLSPVHHHHHHHHFHYASLHLCTTPDSKLNLFINPSHHSLPHLFGRFLRIFMTISGLNCSSFFSFCFALFVYFFDSCDRLSWFYQLLNCMLNTCTFLTFTFLSFIACKNCGICFFHFFTIHRFVRWTDRHFTCG